ncbi:MAG TPA: NAD(P)/FAD-dependent oxidoreductase [Terriglobales bacterium]|nr:NAD(P)/FAD-dependent oxidoreductase [Terriglobales bacterium]
MPFEAIIVGGGIAGLATGTALARRRWRVTVFESREELRVTGSGIYLHNNGLTVLSELGAYERAMCNPFLGRAWEQRDHLGQIILPGDLPSSVRMVSIPRSDLMAGLEGAAREAGVQVVTGLEVVEARSDGTLIFPNGDRIQADVAIGCDGASSRIRRSLGLELYHERSSEGALRTIVRGTQDEMAPEARGRFIENWNGKRRLLVTPMKLDEVYLALTCPADDVEARDTRIRPCWKESFPQWANLIDRIVPGQVSWNVYSVVKCKSWSAGRACLVGDAAHATTPNLGQGGGMAMQNGLALAAYLANVEDRRDIPAALEAWEAAMRPLIDASQRWASLFGEFANIPNEVRPRIIRAALNDPWIQSQMAVAAASAPITHVAWSPEAAGEVGPLRRSR